MLNINWIYDAAEYFSTFLRMPLTYKAFNFAEFHFINFIVVTCVFGFHLHFNASIMWFVTCVYVECMYVCVYAGTEILFLLS